MCRMSELKPEDQNPMASSPEPGEDALADTQPRRVRLASAAEPEGSQQDLAQTQVVPASTDEFPGGLENTLPPPPESAAAPAIAAQADLENTIPPSPEGEAAEIPVARYRGYHLDHARSRGSLRRTAPAEENRQEETPAVLPAQRPALADHPAPGAGRPAADRPDQRLRRLFIRHRPAPRR